MPGTRGPADPGAVAPVRHGQQPGPRPRPRATRCMPCVCPVCLFLMRMHLNKAGMGGGLPNPYCDPRPKKMFVGNTETLGSLIFSFSQVVALPN